MRVLRGSTSRSSEQVRIGLALCAISVVVGGAVLAVLASVGAAAVTAPQSGWSWGNPSPQGSGLSSIDFARGRGYAAGGNGTVLRTDDGGTSWSGLPTGTSASLVRLQVIDPDTLVVLGDPGCVLRRSDDGGRTFRKMFTVTDRGCPTPVAAFTFVGRQLGYLLLKDGSVLRTDDGGQTFARRTAVPGTPANNNYSAPNIANDIAFTSPSDGIAFVSPPNNAPSIAFKTSDGANSWTPVERVDPGAVSRAYFLDSRNGYAVGLNTLLATSDGGNTWTARPAGAGHYLTSIRCADTQTC